MCVVWDFREGLKRFSKWKAVPTLGSLCMKTIKIFLFAGNMNMHKKILNNLTQ